MDVKNIKTHTLLYAIGVIGSILSVVGLIFFTTFPCKTLQNVENINNNNFYSFIYFNNNNITQNISLNNEIFSLYAYNKEKKELKLYYDNLLLFFSDLFSNDLKSNVLVLFELLVFLLMNTIINFSQIIMLKRLDAIILIVNINFNYFFGRILYLILSDVAEVEIVNFKFFFLKEFQEILSIIAYLIYMEIIELKFCGLDYDLKKNIRKRSIRDYQSVHEKINEEEEYDDLNEKEEDIA